MDDVAVHDRIRYWMEQAGLKPAELAKSCGVTPGAVSQWLDGSVEPRGPRLREIARACGISMRIFWGDVAA